MSDKKTHSESSESTYNNAAAAKAPWSWSKKLGFRILFIFVLAMSIPTTGSWYNNLFTLDWFHPHYRDIYDIARFSPSYTGFFGGGRQGGDDADAGAAPKESADDKGEKGKRHRSADNDTTQAAAGIEGGKHHPHHGDGNAALAGNDNAGGKKHHHKDNDTTQVANGEGKHHRHHGDGDAALADNNNGGGKHHHHGGNDTTQVAGENGGSKHHHHKDNDTTQLANGNGGGKHHHHHGDSSLTGGGHKDSTLVAGESFGRKDSTAKVAAATDNSRGKGGNDQAPPKKSFLVDYTDWGIALLIAIVGGLIWTAVDRKSQTYHILYYWIRVVARYRAGIGIIGFGFTKLFPTQMPYPSLGLLNSNFGDYTAQKIYWLSVGIVPWYQVFGGVVEILAGGMLFFRKTSTFGAILLVGALGDITFVNYAYDGGVHVYAFYFVLLGLIIASDDFPKLYNLLVLERYTVPYRVYPDFTKPGLKYTRIVLKALTFIIFFGILTYTEVINFKYDPYKQPSTAGVKQLRGNYHVTTFKINGQEIPYSPLDSVRWQEATFENWTTLTFRVNHPVVIDPSNGGGSPMHDIQRTFEITGVAGGQRGFHYLADTVDKVLYLQDKNVAASGRGGRGGRNRKNAEKPKQDNWISKTALQHIGDEKKMIDPAAWSTRRDREFAAKAREPKRNRMILKYDAINNGDEVILSGINEHKDSIYVVLNRYDRKYVLPASTLKAGKY